MTIKEVSLNFHISRDTLRYYEKVGLLGPIPKNSSGIRDYRESDLKRLEFVKCMRDAGLPIEVLAKYLELYELGEETLSERKQLLSQQRDALKEKIDLMQEAYEKLTYKISLYEEKKLDDFLDQSKKNE